MRPDSLVERAVIVLIAAIVALGAVMLEDGRFDTTWQSYQNRGIR